MRSQNLAWEVFVYKSKNRRACLGQKEKLRVLKGKLSEELQGSRDRNLKLKVGAIFLATKLGNVSEAARQLGISRQVLSKWIARLTRGDFKLKSLRERSRRPKTRDRKRISRQIEKKIKRLRKKYRLGSLQIRMSLWQEEIVVSKTTIQHVLNRRQKPVVKKRSRRATHKKRYELPIPGQRLQIDVKYGPFLINGKRPYVFVAVDECTRWRFARAYPELNHFMTEDFLNRLKLCAPFPLQNLQTDNGFEFTFRLSVGEKAMHRMKLWCDRFRIHHRLIPPGVKELNGKVERSHRIDDEHFYWRADLSSMKHFNLSLDRWIRFYNHKRPHYGLHGLTPMQKIAERLENLPFEAVEDRFLPEKVEFLKRMLIQPLDTTEALLRELKAQLTIYNDYCGDPMLPISPARTRPPHAAFTAE